MFISFGDFGNHILLIYCCAMYNCSVCYIDKSNSMYWGGGVVNIQASKYS